MKPATSTCACCLKPAPVFHVCGLCDAVVCRVCLTSRHVCAKPAAPTEAA